MKRFSCSRLFAVVQIFKLKLIDCVSDSSSWTVEQITISQMATR